LVNAPTLNWLSADFPAQYMQRPVPSMVAPRDGNLGTGTRPDPTGMGTGTIFYPRVAPVPDPNRDRFRTGIFSHPRVTRRVPDTLLPL
jgi:hypothetical protein